MAERLGPPDQVEAMTLGDRIAVMKDGLVQQFGTPADVYECPANRCVAGFIGSPNMNFLPATLRAGDACAALLRLGPSELRLPGRVGDREPREVVAGLRPEHFRPATPDAANSVPITIDLLEPTGADTFAAARLDGQLLTERYAPRQAPRPGEQVWVSVDSDAVCVFDRRTERRIA